MKEPNAMDAIKAVITLYEYCQNTYCTRSCVHGDEYEYGEGYNSCPLCRMCGDTEAASGAKTWIPKYFNHAPAEWDDIHFELGFREASEATGDWRWQQD